MPCVTPNTEVGLGVGEPPKPVAQYFSLSTEQAEAKRLVVWGQPELNSVKRGGGQGASEMALWADTCHQTWQPEFLSSISRTHKMEGQNWFPQIVLWFPLAHPDTCTQNRQVNKNIKKELAEASKPS